ncbi:MAG: putative protein N(5)-glutamine methyltransferase [Frankiaceae bacterium]|nr:putative protein N(5)-glutamine methyltransferase [Frankiaceae bacterium]MBV9870102.1 putative protein N(5)-glutamine methyltransferase [Frankiaceae bacterium]
MTIPIAWVDHRVVDSLTDQLRAAGCVYAEAEATVLRSAATSADQLAEFLAARLGGMPLEHVVGYAKFCGLRIDLPPGVFVPRQRSRLLVRLAIELLHPGAVVVDLCCGSGAIGMAIAAVVDGVSLHAVDIDPNAVACAAANLREYDGHVYLGDLTGGLPSTLRGQVDVIVANAPYVPSAEIDFMPAEARDHEPRIALDGGGDGTEIQRRIATQAPIWLRAGGALLIETSTAHADATAAACLAGGLTARVVADADLDATAVVARKP